MPLTYGMKSKSNAGLLPHDLDSVTVELGVDKEITEAATGLSSLGGVGGIVDDVLRHFRYFLSLFVCKYIIACGIEIVNPFLGIYMIFTVSGCAGQTKYNY